MPRFRPIWAGKGWRLAPATGSRAGSWIWSAFRLAEVRMRIPIVLVVAALVVGRWDVIRNYWDHCTRALTPESTAKRPISSDTEYFCPMDPGVVSHGPGRCGVCNMALVRRKRGDAVMLPDGVVARMQLSPYRIQLAGIQTAPLGYLPLNREWSTSGLVTRESDAAFTVMVDVPGRQVPWVKQGQAVEVACAELSGQETLKGWIRSLVRGVDDGREFAHVTVAIEKPPQSLKGGMIAVVKLRTAVAALEPFRHMPSNPPVRKQGEPERIYVCHDHPETIALEPGRCPIDGKTRMSQALGELERLEWWCPMHSGVRSEKSGGVCEKCGGMALQARVLYYAPRDQVLALPQSAVVDTGARKVVFVETMPGMFDGVEVVVGPRCGDFYPVVRGLEPGQNVAVAGAFLLDAETRLNPSLAAGYFGARGRDPLVAAAGPSSVGPSGHSAAQADSFASLTPEDRALAERQKNCPVTGMALGRDGCSEACDRFRPRSVPLLQCVRIQAARGAGEIPGKACSSFPMIDAIITFSIRHRTAVIIASLVLAALGGWAVWDTPVDAIPDLSENQVIVFTEWKGHGPREIEDQVTYPLTLGLRGLGGVRVVRSSSDVGFSTISVIFADPVPIDRARQRVAERLGQLLGQLPAGATPELAPDSPATGQIFWYTVEGGGLDLGRLRAIQDWYVRPQLGSVPGVADVSSVGGFPIEYEVVPDPDRLRLFGVTLKDLVEAVGAANVATGGHVVNKGNAEYVVRGVGWLGASTRPGDDSFDQGARDPRSRERRPAHGRRTDNPAGGGRDGWHRPRFPPRCSGKGRQRGGRRCGSHGPRRESARGHPADPGEDPRASGRPAARRPDRAVLRPHSPDRGGNSYGQRHGPRGDGVGLVVRPGDLAPCADVTRHRGHAAACCALVVSDHGGAAPAGRG